MFFLGLSWKIWEHWGLVLALSTRILVRPAGLSKISLLNLSLFSLEHAKADLELNDLWSDL